MLVFWSCIRVYLECVGEGEEDRVYCESWVFLEIGGRILFSVGGGF